MSFDSVYRIAGSSMNAQTVRLNTVASNLANADTAAARAEDVYQARKPVFAAIQHDALLQAMSGDASAGNLMPQTGDAGSQGVQVLDIVESDAALEMRYEPDHPMANEDGYVMYPNVNVVEEMADMLSASRSFQTNVDVMDAAKTMLQRVLTLGQ